MVALHCVWLCEGGGPWLAPPPRHTEGPGPVRLPSQHRALQRTHLATHTTRHRHQVHYWSFFTVPSLSTLPSPSSICHSPTPHLPKHHFSLNNQVHPPPSPLPPCVARAGADSPVRALSCACSVPAQSHSRGEGRADTGARPAITPRPQPPCSRAAPPRRASPRPRGTQGILYKV